MPIGSALRKRLITALSGYNAGGDLAAYLDGLESDIQALGGGESTGVSLLKGSGGATMSYQTINAAVAAAEAGDVVQIFPGTYSEDVALSVDGINFLGVGGSQRVVLTGVWSVPTSCSINRVTFRGRTDGAPALTVNGVGKVVVLYNLNVQGGGANAPVVRVDSASVVVGFLNQFTYNGGAAPSMVQILDGEVVIQNILAAIGAVDDLIDQDGGTLFVNGANALENSLFTATDFLDISGGACVVNNMQTPRASIPYTNTFHVSGDGVSLASSGGALQSTAFDLLVDPALVGTGTILDIDSRMTFARVSVPAGYRDVANTRLNFGTITGWANYQDGTHTVGSPQALLAATRAQLTIDAATTLSTYRQGPGELWSGDKITPNEEGEAYSVRIDFTILPGATTGILDIDLDIGSDPFGASSVIIVRRSLSLAKGTAIQYVSVAFPIYCLATFLANGGAIGLTCSVAADVYDKSVSLFRIH